MNTFFKSFLFLSLFIFSPQLQAQVCGSGYERDERDKIQVLYPKVGFYLTQMAVLAEITANSSDLTLSEITEANHRYQRIKLALYKFSQEERRNLSELGNSFISDVSSPEYLQIQNTLIGGSSNSESQSNSREAMDKLNAALVNSNICFKNSWIRHGIKGTENDGICAGGFDSMDKLEVRVKVGQLGKLLYDMASIAEVVANNSLPRPYRIISDADYQFIKEEIEILGELRLKNVSNRTKNFIKTFIDPIFLGINNTSLNGESDEASQENARESLDSLNMALFEIGRCTK